MYTSDFATVKIPSNAYWVMGDNRGNSKDSRVFGVITKSKIVGRVFIRIWPLSRLDGSCSGPAARLVVSSHSDTVATIRSGRSQ